MADKEKSLGKDKSIIEVIQKMVSDNEPEDKIVSTLVTLGVSKEQAKKLLLIAEADTLTLLNSELEKIVDKNVNERKREIELHAKEFIERELEKGRDAVEGDLEKEVLKYKLELSKSQEGFQNSVNDSISKVAKLNEEVYLLSEENKKMITSVQKDLSETKLKGLKLRRSVARDIILAFGVICLLMAVFAAGAFVFVGFNIDFVTAAAVFAFIGAVVMYFSTNI